MFYCFRFAHVTEVDNGCVGLLQLAKKCPKRELEGVLFNVDGEENRLCPIQLGEETDRATAMMTTLLDARPHRKQFKIGTMTGRGGAKQ